MSPQIIPPQGLVNTGWSNLNYGTGWESYGFPYFDVQWKRSGDIVYLRGLCKRTSGSSDVIGYLPYEAYPPLNVVIDVLSLDLVGRVDILLDGRIMRMGASPSWISFDSQFFSIALPS